MKYFNLFSKKKKLAANRKKALSHVLYGSNLASDNQYDDAILMFKKAIDIDDNCAEAHYGLGLVYAKKDMENEAFEEYNKAVKINPDYKIIMEKFGIGRSDDFDIIKELKKKKDQD